jgi:prephenate dehydrogenase
MAGSEKSGYEHSRPDLYDRASVLITPGRFNRKGDVERLKSFWESLGSTVSVTSARLHDLMVGYTSHLPHVIACALVDLVQGRSESGIRDFIGNGFRDVTRISSGSGNMWSDIVRLNRANIGEGIDEFVKKLLELKKMLAEGGDEQIRGYFEKVRRDRGDII